MVRKSSSGARTGHRFAASSVALSSRLNASHNAAFSCEDNRT